VFLLQMKMKGKDKKIQIKHSVSLWNYFHYMKTPGLNHTIELLRQWNFGIELWNRFGEHEDLFSKSMIAKLKPQLQGMDISIHSADGNDFDFHKKQIDAAADYGAKVVVLHTDNLTDKKDLSLNIELAKNITNYASNCGVSLALENGEFDFLVNALKNIEGLKICLDLGHVYFTSDPLEKYLKTFKHRIIHLHIHDVFPQGHESTSHTFQEHYIPGTGKIHKDDWDLLISILKEIDFEGMAVFEIAPRDPLQTAFIARSFMEQL
jgi:sugar phosphate isomerase/epimerase